MVHKCRICAIKLKKNSAEERNLLLKETLPLIASGVD
jgi:hypothetical protein